MNKKNKTITIEELCYQNFINSKNNLETMKMYATDLGITIESFLFLVYKHIEKNINKPDYVKYLDIISILNDEEVIKFFKLIKVDYNYLKNNLLSYYINYRPNIYYLKPENLLILREKLNKYNNYLYRQLDPIRTSTKIDLEYAINIVKLFINSKFSLNRFCFNNHISISNFKNYVSNVKKYDLNLYNEYTNTIALKEYIKSNTITNDVIKILNEIKENDNFSIIDFCNLTNYDVLELIKVSDDILNINDSKIFRKAIKPFRNIDVLNEERLTRLFKTSFTLNINNKLINITDEDKYTIINYLYLYNIPICNESFKEGCIKLYNTKENYIVKSK